MCVFDADTAAAAAAAAVTHARIVCSIAQGVEKHSLQSTVGMRPALTARDISLCNITLRRLSTERGGLQN